MTQNIGRTGRKKREVSIWTESIFRYQQHSGEWLVSVGTEVSFSQYFLYVKNMEREGTLFHATANVTPCDKYDTLEELLLALENILEKHNIGGIDTNVGFISYKLSEIVRQKSPPTMTDEEYLKMMSREDTASEY